MAICQSTAAGRNDFIYIKSEFGRIYTALNLFFLLFVMLPLLNNDNKGNDHKKNSTTWQNRKTHVLIMIINV